jgi:hypothetical protein
MVVVAKVEAGRAFTVSSLFSDKAPVYARRRLFSPIRISGARRMVMNSVVAMIRGHEAAK